MKTTNNKLKIKRNGKSYALNDSPLYKITSKKKLLSILSRTPVTISDLTKAIGDYSIFIDKKNPLKPRTIEKPNKNLDIYQSRIASLLCRIESPDFLHSGTKKRSHVSNAKAHLANENTFTTDIKSFFPSTPIEKVFSFFYSVMKCEPDVSEILAKLCTCNGHIPTGSRISMPMSFWANEKMFSELQNLSIQYNVKMTLYVDDITFTGNNVNRIFVSTVKKIISRHGHIMHPKKSTLYLKGSVKVITGVVVRNGMALAKNEQHKNLYQDIELLKGFGGKPSPPEKLIDRTLGRINSLSVIESRYKDKARSLWSLIK
jgi:hypothetical protein